MELAGEPWPDVPSDDPLAELARRFVLTLREAMDGRSVNSVAIAAGMHHQTLLNVLAGKVWPDFATIARLEMTLQTSLWPGRADRS